MPWKMDNKMLHLLSVLLHCFCVKVFLVIYYSHLPNCSSNLISHSYFWKRHNVFIFYRTWSKKQSLILKILRNLIFNQLSLKIIDYILTHAYSWNEALNCLKLINLRINSDLSLILWLCLHTSLFMWKEIFI